MSSEKPKPGPSTLIQSFKREIQLFTIGMAFSLVAKGVALFPFAQSLDSYPKLVALSANPNQAAGVFEEFVAQGRLGQWALQKFLAVLGIVGPGGNTIYVLMALCCFAAAGVLLCKLWRLDDDTFLPILVVGLFVIHPYHAEIFTYREATVTVGLAVLLTMSGLVVANRYGRQWVLGCFLLAGSLSLYQIAINYAVIALIVLCLIEWARSGSTWLPLRTQADEGKGFVQTVAPRALAIAASVVVYFLVYKLTLGLVPSASKSVESPRAAVLELGEIPERLIHILRTLKFVFTASEPLMPIVTKTMIGVLWLLAGMVLARRAWSRPGGTGFGRWRELAMAGALLLTASFAIVGVMIGLRGYYPVDRTLAAASVLVAGLLVIVVLNGGLGVRHLALGLGSVLLLSFAGVNNVVLAEQLRLNNRDRGMANRIIMRLENDPAFASVRKIAVIGRMREYPLRFYSAKNGSDVNCSAFSQSWSKANILREVSGYEFVDASGEDLDRARRYCREAKPWPHPESVVVLGDVAVIYLSNEP